MMRANKIFNGLIYTLVLVISMSAPVLSTTAYADDDDDIEFAPYAEEIENLEELYEDNELQAIIATAQLLQKSLNDASRTYEQLQDLSQDLSQNLPQDIANQTDGVVNQQTIDAANQVIGQASATAQSLQGNLIDALPYNIPESLANELTDTLSNMADIPVAGIVTNTNNRQAAANTEVAASASAANYSVSSDAPAVAVDKLILNNPVVDEAGLLTDGEKQHISYLLKDLYQKKLAQAAVVIVSTTDGEPVFDYAMQVAERWQLGAADTDDGLLLLIAVNDRKMHIVTGYGLEGVLPDATVSRIMRRDITPKFKRNDYAGGILAGVAALSERLHKAQGLSSDVVYADGSKLTNFGDYNEYAKSNYGAGKEQGLLDNTHDNVIGNTEPITLFMIGIFFGGIVTSILGRFLGSSLVAGAFFVMAGDAGMGIVLCVVLTLFLWFYLLGMSSYFSGGKYGSGRSSSRRSGRRSGRRVIFPSSSGGSGGRSSRGSSGGFGGGGFSGGGGGFGGGGAGGSW